MLPIERVPLTRINLEDGRYRISTRGDLEELAASIRSIGLIHPPVLKKEENEYLVVCGFRRISCIFDIGWKEIESRILPEEYSDTVCAGLAIADNAMQRPLNIVEQARAYALLSRVHTGVKDLSAIAASHGLEGNPKYIAKMLAVAGLPERIQNEVADGIIPLPVAEALSGLPDDAAFAFTEIFSTLKPGLNVQREMMTLTREICARDGVGITAFLRDAEIRNIVTDDAMDRGKKIRELRQWLRQKRFPALTAAEKRRDEIIGSLNFGANMRLIPPPNFEGTTYLIEMSFSELAQLRKDVKRLERLIETPPFSKLLSNTDS